jgi:hypothetical protein
VTSSPDPRLALLFMPRTCHPPASSIQSEVVLERGGLVSSGRLCWEHFCHLSRYLSLSRLLSLFLAAGLLLLVLALDLLGHGLFKKLQDLLVSDLLVRLELAEVRGGRGTQTENTVLGEC